MTDTTLHPVWLAAFGVLGLFLTYITVAGYLNHGRFLAEVLPAGVAAVALLAAVGLDLGGVLS